MHQSQKWHSQCSSSEPEVRTSQAQAPSTFAKQESAAFNHAPSSDIERQYDQLREKAHAEDRLQKENVGKSKDAYAQGDGAGAKQFSNIAKQHAANEERFNRQARDLIFRENNSHLPGDTIDLHGLYVSEVEEVLTTRINAGQQRNESHLHVIVGKGIHSQGHVQKIKPETERILRQMGLNFQTEHNEGRVYVDLTGGQVHQMPPPPSGWDNNWGKPQYGGNNGYPGGQTQHHGGQSQHHGDGGGHAQQNQQDEEIEQAVKGCMKLFRGCCVVM